MHTYHINDVDFSFHKNGTLHINPYGAVIKLQHIRQFTAREIAQIIADIVASNRPAVGEASIIKLVDLIIPIMVADYGFLRYVTPVADKDRSVTWNVQGPDRAVVLQRMASDVPYGINPDRPVTVGAFDPLSDPIYASMTPAQRAYVDQVNYQGFQLGLCAGMRMGVGSPGGVDAVEQILANPEFKERGMPGIYSKLISAAADIADALETPPPTLRQTLRVVSSTSTEE